jgi:hypothetical protein
VAKFDGRVLSVLFGVLAGPALGAIGNAMLGDAALIDLTAVGIVLGATFGATLSSLLVSPSHRGLPDF